MKSRASQCFVVLTVWSPGLSVAPARAHREGGQREIKVTALLGV